VLANMAEEIANGGGTRRLWGAVGVFVVTVMSMAWFYLTHHQIFPDTQLYLGWTYRLMGYDPATAERMVFDYIRSDAVFPPYEALWTGGVLDLSYRPRLLLPVLSVPFVAAFGPGGIVVVPGIAFLVAMLLCYRFATIHADVPAAVAACAVALLSSLVVIWSIGGLTDSLAVMLHAAWFLLLPWRAPGTWPRLLGIVGVCALAATARLITPYTVMAIAGLWLWAMLRGDRALRRSWTVAAGATLVGSALALLWTRWATSPLTVISTFTAVTQGGVRRYADLPGWYLHELPGRLATEGGHLLRNVPLAILIAMSLVACVTARHTVVPWLVVPAWLGALGLLMLNPYVTFFRLELPVLPATIVGAAVLVDQVQHRVLRTAVGAPAPVGWRADPPG